MADAGRQTGSSETIKSIGSSIERFAPLVVGTGLTVWVLSEIFQRSNGEFDARIAAWAAGAVVLGVVVTVALRMTLVHDSPPPVAAVTPDDPLRARIAPMIIGIGTLGIIILSVAVATIVGVVAYNGHANIKDKIDTILLSIFASTLPVFATWVGTVLAFYFSNESFRQASESARGLGSIPEPERISDLKRMIPYEKIAKIELKEGDPKAEETTLAEVRKRFNDAVTRVIIFDKNRFPIFIIRKKLDTNTQATKVADYLATERNLADATNFRFLPVHATVDDARRTLKLYNTADIFVTDGGSSNEPTKGWVTDDRLA